MTGPEDWLRHIREGIRADPHLPPGAVVMRSGIDQVISVSEATRTHAEYVVSDLLAEDARSVIESADYVVRYREGGPAITCECCGTPVAAMPERPSADRATAWKPGIWEPGTGRRHTLRRCEWKRENP
jgi:hypothetical protein